MAQMPQQTQPADAQAAPDDDSADADQGFLICIKVGADGKVQSVYSEPAAEEASEGEDADQGQPAISWRDAMQVAAQLYKSGGQADNGDAQSQFSAGYSGGTPATGGM